MGRALAYETTQRHEFHILPYSGPVKNTSFEVPERNWRKRVPNLGAMQCHNGFPDGIPLRGLGMLNTITSGHASAITRPLVPTWKTLRSTHLRTSTHTIKNKTQTKTSTMSTSFRFVSNQSLRKGVEKKASSSGIAAMTSELQFVQALRNHWSVLSSRKFLTKTMCHHVSSCVIHHLFL